MKSVSLTKGAVAWVDDEDFDKVSKFKWHLEDGSSGLLYAARWDYSTEPRTLVMMHRFLMGIIDPHIQVDHRDHYGLLNVKSNLRLATVQQNQWNQRPHKDGKSEYKGVSWRSDRSKWVARIFAEGKKHHLGTFTNEIVAAKAYDAAALHYFGEFAYLNFKEKP